MHHSLRFFGTAALLAGAGYVAAACGGSSSRDEFTAPSEGGSSGQAGGGEGAGGEGTVGGGSTSSGSSSSGSGGMTSGPPRDTPVTDLDDDDFDDLCDDLTDAVNDLRDSEAFEQFYCRAVGLSLALAASGVDFENTDGGLPDVDLEQLRSDCQEAYDQCVDVPIPPPGECDRPGEDCDVTVGEVRECIDQAEFFSEDVGEALPACEEATLLNIVTAFVLLEQRGISLDACENAGRCGNMSNPTPSE
jgi:hypothetical protein